MLLAVRPVTQAPWHRRFLHGRSGGPLYLWPLALRLRRPLTHISSSSSSLDRPALSHRNGCKSKKPQTCSFVRPAMTSSASSSSNLLLHFNRLRLPFRQRQHFDRQVDGRDDDPSPNVVQSFRSCSERLHRLKASSSHHIFPCRPHPHGVDPSGRGHFSPTVASRW